MRLSKKAPIPSEVWNSESHITWASCQEMLVASSPSPHLLQFPVSSSAHHPLFSEITCSPFFLSSWPPPFLISFVKTNSLVFPISVRGAKCCSKSTGESWSDSENLTGSADDSQSSVATTGGFQRIAASPSDSLSLGIREPVYEVRKNFFPIFPLSRFYDGLLLVLALGGRGEVGW